MRDAAAKRAARADRHVRDVMRDTWQKAAESAAGDRRLEPPMPDKRANAQRTVFLPHIIERIDAIDVDQADGSSEAKIHRRHEALAASEHLALVPILGEEIECCLDRARRKILEGGGF